MALEAGGVVVELGMMDFRWIERPTARGAEGEMHGFSWDGREYFASQGSGASGA